MRLKKYRAPQAEGAIAKSEDASLISAKRSAYDELEYDVLLDKVQALNAQLHLLQQHQRSGGSWVKVVRNPILENISEVFSIYPVENYVDLMSKVGKTNKSFDAWQKTAEQMRNAITKFQVKNDRNRNKLNAA